MVLFHICIKLQTSLLISAATPSTQQDTHMLSAVVTNVTQTNVQ